MLQNFVVEAVEKYTWNSQAQLMDIKYIDGSEELYYGVVEYSILHGLENPGYGLTIEIRCSHFIPVKNYSSMIYMNKKTFKAEQKIKNVIFNYPATIVFWSDGTKTVVKCGENDIYDPEKGLAMAVAKKYLGTNKSHSNYMDEFKKWLPKEEEPSNPIEDVVDSIKKVAEFYSSLKEKEND